MMPWTLRTLRGVCLLLLITAPSAFRARVCVGLCDGDDASACWSTGGAAGPSHAIPAVNQLLSRNLTAVRASGVDPAAAGLSASPCGPAPFRAYEAAPYLDPGAAYGGGPAGDAGDFSELEGAASSKEQPTLFAATVGRQKCPGERLDPASGVLVCTSVLAGVCDARVGVCVCRVGYTGEACGSCAPSHTRTRTAGGVDVCTQIRHCPRGCSGAGTCNVTTGVCTCVAGRFGRDCGVGGPRSVGLGCAAERNGMCVACDDGFFRSVNASSGVATCAPCHVFDPRCASCTSTGCTACADTHVLTGAARAGRRIRDARPLSLFDVEEGLRATVGPVPFGMQSAHAFLHAEPFALVRGAPEPGTVAAACRQAQLAGEGGIQQQILVTDGATSEQTGHREYRVNCTWPTGSSAALPQMGALPTTGLSPGWVLAPPVYPPGLLADTDAAVPTLYELTRAHRLGFNQSRYSLATRVSAQSLPLSVPASEITADAARNLQQMEAFQCDMSVVAWSRQTWSCNRVVTSHVVCGSPGVVNFDESVVVVNETAGHLFIRVSRSGGGVGRVSVDVEVADGETRAALTSQQLRRMTLVLEPGVVQLNVPLLIYDDDLLNEGVALACDPAQCRDCQSTCGVQQPLHPVHSWRSMLPPHSIVTLRLVGALGGAEVGPRREMSVALLDDEIVAPTRSNSQLELRCHQAPCGRVGTDMVASVSLQDPFRRGVSDDLYGQPDIVAVPTRVSGQRGIAVAVDTLALNTTGQWTGRAMLNEAVMYAAVLRLWRRGSLRRTTRTIGTATTSNVHIAHALSSLRQRGTSMVWEGGLAVPNGTSLFAIHALGAMRVWLDGTLVADTWDEPVLHAYAADSRSSGNELASPPDVCAIGLAPGLCAVDPRARDTAALCTHVGGAIGVRCSLFQQSNRTAAALPTRSDAGEDFRRLELKQSLSTHIALEAMQPYAVAVRAIKARVASIRLELRSLSGTASAALRASPALFIIDARAPRQAITAAIRARDLRPNTTVDVHTATLRRRDARFVALETWDAAPGAATSTLRPTTGTTLQIAIREVLCNTTVDTRQASAIERSTEAHATWAHQQAGLGEVRLYLQPRDSFANIADSRTFQYAAEARLVQPPPRLLSFNADAFSCSITVVAVAPDNSSACPCNSSFTSTCRPLAFRLDSTLNRWSASWMPGRSGQFQIRGAEYAAEGLLPRHLPRITLWAQSAAAGLSIVPLNGQVSAGSWAHSLVTLVDAGGDAHWQQLHDSTCYPTVSLCHDHCGSEDGTLFHSSCRVNSSMMLQPTAHILHFPICSRQGSGNNSFVLRMPDGDTFRVHVAVPSHHSQHLATTILIVSCKSLASGSTSVFASATLKDGSHFRNVTDVHVLGGAAASSTSHARLIGVRNELVDVVIELRDVYGNFACETSCSNQSHHILLHSVVSSGSGSAVHSLQHCHNVTTRCTIPCNASWCAVEFVLDGQRAGSVFAIDNTGSSAVVSAIMSHVWGPCLLRLYPGSTALSWCLAQLRTAAGAPVVNASATMWLMTLSEASPVGLHRLPDVETLLREASSPTPLVSLAITKGGANVSGAGLHYPMTYGSAGSILTDLSTCNLGGFFASLRLSEGCPVANASFVCSDVLPARCASMSPSCSGSVVPSLSRTPVLARANVTGPSNIVTARLQATHIADGVYLLDLSAVPDTLPAGYYVVNLSFAGAIVFGGTYVTALLPSRAVAATSRFGPVSDARCETITLRKSRCRVRAGDDALILQWAQVDGFGRLSVRPPEALSPYVVILISSQNGAQTMSLATDLRWAVHGKALTTSPLSLRTAGRQHISMRQYRIDEALCILRMSTGESIRIDAAATSEPVSSTTSTLGFEVRLNVSLRVAAAVTCTFLLSPTAFARLPAPRNYSILVAASPAQIQSWNITALMVPEARRSYRSTQQEPTMSATHVTASAAHDVVRVTVTGERLGDAFRWQSGQILGDTARMSTQVNVTNDTLALRFKLDAGRAQPWPAGIVPGVLPMLLTQPDASPAVLHPETDLVGSVEVELVCGAVNATTSTTNVTVSQQYQFTASMTPLDAFGNHVLGGDAAFEAALLVYRVEEVTTSDTPLQPMLWLDNPQPTFASWLPGTAVTLVVHAIVLSCNSSTMCVCKVCDPDVMAAVHGTSVQFSWKGSAGTSYCAATLVGAEGNVSQSVRKLVADSKQAGVVDVGLLSDGHSSATFTVSSSYGLATLRPFLVHESCHDISASKGEAAWLFRFMRSSGGVDAVAGHLLRLPVSATSNDGVQRSVSGWQRECGCVGMPMDSCSNASCQLACSAGSVVGRVVIATYDSVVCDIIPLHHGSLQVQLVAAGVLVDSLTVRARQPLYRGRVSVTTDTDRVAQASVISASGRRELRQHCCCCSCPEEMADVYSPLGRLCSGPPQCGEVSPTKASTTVRAMPNATARLLVSTGPTDGTSSPLAAHVPIWLVASAEASCDACRNGWHPFAAPGSAGTARRLGAVVGAEFVPTVPSEWSRGVWHIHGLVPRPDSARGAAAVAFQTWEDADVFIEGRGAAAACTVRFVPTTSLSGFSESAAVVFSSLLAIRAPLARASVCVSGTAAARVFLDGQHVADTSHVSVANSTSCFALMLLHSVRSYHVVVDVRCVGPCSRSWLHVEWAAESDVLDDSDAPIAMLPALPGHAEACQRTSDIALSLLPAAGTPLWMLT